MSPKVFIISDLHLGHNKILDFSPCRGGNNTESHDELIIEQWNSVVSKRDLVIVLGDVAFSREGLRKVSRLKGTKHLILGNHDKYQIGEYQNYFTIKPSLYKYKGFWLSHAPIHPDELRGLVNIHGHVHSKTIQLRHYGGGYLPDNNYVNVCVENCNGVPVLFNDIINGEF